MRSFRNKFVTIADLPRISRKLKAKGKKIVLAHGAFDLLHYGHVHYLEEARKLGDVLVVSLVDNKFVRKGPNRPVFNENIRARSLASLECIDYVVMCNDFGPWKIIPTLKPHIYAKGDDSADQLKDKKSGLNKDRRLVEKFGGKFKFTKSLSFHSTELLKVYFSVLPPETEKFLDGFRKKYNPSDTIAKLDSLKKLKVLVIGEAIIDEYRYVVPLGKPVKANIISGQYLNTEKFAGGSLACANHVASICDRVDLLTYIGEQDSHEDFIRKSLKKNIQATLVSCPGQPTIIKRRFIEPSYYAKFFEEYIFDKNFLPGKIEQKIAAFLSQKLKSYDLVLVVDYGHGFLSQKLIDIIIKKSKFLAVNAQTNSGNAGFNYISKYPRIDYACLDEMEARLAAHDNSSPIDQIVPKLATSLNIPRIAVTQAGRGALIYEKERGLCQVPSMAHKLVDTIGAGDAFLSISAPCVAAGLDMDITSFVGNVAGAIAVGIVGNKSSVTKEELYRRIGYLLE